MQSVNMKEVHKAIWRAADKELKAAKRKLNRIDERCKLVSGNQHLSEIAAGEWLTQRAVVDVLVWRVDAVWATYENA